MIQPRFRAARPLKLAGAALAMFAGIALIGPMRVLAHAGLESSTPAASSVLESSPPVISLDFDENIDIPLTSIELFDAAQTPIALGEPTQGADGSIVEASVPELQDGTYAVVWRVSSADGHVVAGAFSFQIGTEGSGVDPDELIDDVLHGARAEPAVGRGLGIARFTSFLGASLLLGGLFMVFIVEADSIGWAARRLLWIGWSLLVLGSLANFGLLGANAKAGSVGDITDTSVWGDIADTRTGSLLLVRMVLLVLFVPVLVTIGKRRTTAWQLVVPLLAVFTVFTFSGAGHPSVESNARIWIGVDAIHFALVALWMGSLAMMVLGGRPWLRDPSYEASVRSFSNVVTVAVPVIVATGVLQTWKVGGGWHTLTDTTWGRVLLAKGALAALIVTIGGASRWLLRNEGPRGLGRTVATETAMGVVVLALAAALVGVPPTPGPQSQLYAKSLTEAGVIVDVSITPGQVGANQVHVIVTPPGGNLSPVTSVTARMSLPARDIPNTPVSLVAESPNHYSGNITLPFSGDWTLEIIVAPTPDQTVLLSDTVPIPNPS
jgi:copper transport protein